MVSRALTAISRWRLASGTKTQEPTVPRANSTKPDFEMAFATQEDVLAVAEEVLSETFAKFTDKKVSPAPFPRIPYEEAMLRYGSDKPESAQFPGDH